MKEFYSKIVIDAFLLVYKNFLMYIQSIDILNCVCTLRGKTRIFIEISSNDKCFNELKVPQKLVLSSTVKLRVAQKDQLDQCLH